tara:strand:+ start:77 stop:385 length:309 start_codon:yes stop_codon:yes gene_type:complete
MTSESFNHETLLFQFLGSSHRLFIEGRGFDFDSFNVFNNSTADLQFLGLEDPLFTFLDFEEPRVIYVVSREGDNVLILQGCVFKSIDGVQSKITYSEIQVDS